MDLITSFKLSRFYNINTLLNFLLAINFVFIVKVSFFVIFLHHLPPPFYYEPNNVFMDFFTTNWLSFTPNLYSKFSINYLPFVFGLGQLLSPHPSDISSSYNFRAYALPTILWMVTFYFIAVTLLVNFLKKISLFKDKLYLPLKLYFAVLTSPMLLFALERGNYIILVLLLLTLYELAKPIWARVILAI